MTDAPATWRDDTSLEEDGGPTAADGTTTSAGTLPVAVPGILARVGAEAFGTFTLVLAGVGVALWAAVGGVGGGILAVALAFGIAVMACAVVVGHVSGGHFNPAVTLGVAVAGRMPWRDVLPYWFAQVIGGALAAAVLFIVSASLDALETFDGGHRGFFSGASNGFGEHSPIAAVAGGVGFSLFGALLIEVVVTAVFVLVILGATTERAPSRLAPVVIGLTLTAMILVAAPVTNASVNPARSTATALFSNPWAIEQLWVFWVAPLVGGVIAGAVAYVVFAPKALALGLLEPGEDAPEAHEAPAAHDEATRA